MRIDKTTNERWPATLINMWWVVVESWIMNTTITRTQEAGYERVLPAPQYIINHILLHTHTSFQSYCQEVKCLMLAVMDGTLIIV